VSRSPLAFPEPHRLSLSSLPAFHFYSVTGNLDAPLLVSFQTQYGKKAGISFEDLKLRYFSAEREFDISRILRVQRMAGSTGRTAEP
jgi:hypothetical protein